MKAVKANECQICGKQLSDPQSIALGVGPDCAEKRASFVASCGTSDAEVAQLEATGGKAARWIRNFRIEMRAGNKKLATYWIEAARREAELTRNSADEPPLLADKLRRAA